MNDLCVLKHCQYLRAQMNKEYAFRKTLDRSERLQELTATFLEPVVLQRTKIKSALRNSWVKEGNIKTPDDVIKTNEPNNAVLSNPIITQQLLKEPVFHYQMSEYGKSMSTFNEVFSVVDDTSDY